MTEAAPSEYPAPSSDHPAWQPHGESVLSAVLALPWLAPSAESLVVLSRLPTPTTWSAIHDDPAAVLLLLRCPSPADSLLPFPQTCIHSPLPLELANRILSQTPAGWVGLDASARAILDASRTLAHLTRELARRSGRVDPLQAWCAGLLAPLGWLAICAARPEAAASCLGDPALRREPRATQHRHWQTDHATLARHLARNWELPGWLARVLGRLDLPADQAGRLGAEAALLATVRLAIQRLRLGGFELGLAGVPALADEELAGVRQSELESLALVQAEPAVPLRSSPYWQPLLSDLLTVASDQRRQRQEDRLVRLECEVDELHAALREQIDGEANRLQLAKLAALAEFAAGAGHEVNNPLAVISGQAQYLLGHKGDWFAADAETEVRSALQTIIAQTKRIHGILRDLMLFARPAPPRPAWFDLPTLLGQVAAELREVAGQKQVRLEVQSRPDRLAILADAEQVRAALTCLLRNALEAAPPGGWARLSLAEPGASQVEIVIEDSGPGPTAEQRQHLFDPFYSGRQAGRGRGLGLSIAWRLTRNQGGEIVLEPARVGMPTRFLLRLPRPAPDSQAA